MKVPFSPRAWCSVIPFGLPAVKVWQLVADLLTSGRMLTQVGDELRWARIRLPQLVDELLT